METMANIFVGLMGCLLVLGVALAVSGLISAALAPTDDEPGPLPEEKDWPDE